MKSLTIKSNIFQTGKDSIYWAVLTANNQDKVEIRCMQGNELTNDYNDVIQRNYSVEEINAAIVDNELLIADWLSNFDKDEMPENIVQLAVHYSAVKALYSYASANSVELGQYRYEVYIDTCLTSDIDVSYIDGNVSNYRLDNTVKRWWKVHENSEISQTMAYSIQSAESIFCKGGEEIEYAEIGKAKYVLRNYQNQWMHKTYYLGTRKEVEEILKSKVYPVCDRLPDFNLFIS